MIRYPVQTALTAALLLALPALLADYVLFRVTDALVYAIAILGLNFLTGTTGLFSIGQSAFCAVGAYVVAIGMTSYGLSPYLVLPLSAVAGFCFGFVTGWPALRLSTVHLALATWGLALAVPQLLKSDLLAPLTNGVQGIYIRRPGPPFGLPLSDDQWWYLVTLALLALTAFLIGNMMESRTGRALRAVRDHPDGASAMGINISLYRASAFGVAGAAAALAGGIDGLLADFIAADNYTLFLSIALLIGAVAGGVDTVRGAFVGGALAAYLPDISGLVSKTLSFPAHGLVLIALVFLMPKGIVPSLDLGLARLARMFGR
ncbi:MAG: branched-chain amino acid ABC transporter permease [Pseudomonadota bacterium]|nr:branched-chain amino acid ABC transporter permease [Pseudomonadota bacterium]